VKPEETNFIGLEIHNNKINSPCKKNNPYSQIEEKVALGYIGPRRAKELKQT
jgi:hypothetical protein